MSRRHRSRSRSRERTRDRRSRSREKRRSRSRSRVRGVRNSAARLYVGHLSSKTRTRDIETLFAEYGRLSDIVFKANQDYAHVEFERERDAAEAVKRLDETKLCGSRITVRYARGSNRKRSASPERTREVTKCYNCGKNGHWARECPQQDMSNRCYRCGGKGHKQSKCTGHPADKSQTLEKTDRSPKKSRSRSRRRRSRDDSAESRGASGERVSQEKLQERKSRSRERDSEHQEPTKSREKSIEKLETRSVRSEEERDPLSDRD